MIRVCICGGRDYYNKSRVFQVLDFTYERIPFVLISGGATGADTLGIRWAKYRKVPCEVYPADWTRYGKSAGPKRNIKMIESGIDVLLAFPGGRGTKHMIDSCRKRNIKVVEIEDKQVSHEISDIG
jgi:hypothetical protein